MKNITTLLVLFLASLNSISQELVSENGVTITASDKFYFDKLDMDSYEAIGEKGFVGRFSNDEKDEDKKVEKLLSFDREMNHEELPMDIVHYYKGEDREFVRPFSVGDRYFLLRGTVDKEKLTNVFSWVEIDADGEPLGDENMLAEIVGEEYYAGPKNAWLHEEFSEDGESILITLKMPERRRGEERRHRVYRYFIYDLDMNLQWEKEVEYLHDGGRVVYHGSKFFKNDGTILSWAIFDRGRKVEKGSPRFAYRFYRINQQGVEYSEIDLKKKMDYPTSKVTNDFVYLFDTYGIDNGEGYRMLKWNSKTLDGEIKYIPFGKDHLIKYQDEKAIKKIESIAAKGKPLFIPKYIENKVITMENGGFLFTGQEGFSKSLGDSKYNPTIEYYRQDYHLMAIDANGEKLWSEIIPMDQKTIGKDYGCLIKPVKKNVYVIFHDNEENLAPGGWNSTKELAKYKGKKQGLGMVVIDTENPNATQKRQLLCRFDRLDSWITPGSFYTEPELDFGVMYDYLDKKSYRMLQFEFD